MWVSIAVGIVTVIGAAIPIFYKWKKLHDEETNHVDVASDNRAVHDLASERVQQRLESLRKDGSGGEKE
jgi:hypothetical protein